MGLPVASWQQQFMTAATLQTDYITAVQKQRSRKQQHSNLQSQRKYTDDQGLGKHVSQYEIWQQKENQKDQKGRCKERCHNYFSQCV